ncbi:peptidoglycan -binding protein [Humitalea sp. 24SJ18S-53]|uniref:peptidoglycan -binding protein n=1 Tax=Humitalea sp. 24SJ18S-53 TaxID=3422307 RepID=UPI003D666050
MASFGRRRDREALNPWPGYVDALATLLMVIIFVLLVFVLAQGFLSVTLSTRDRALDRLNRQVAELAELLALERGQVGELRASLGRTQDELRAATAARDSAQGQVATLRDAAARATADRDTARAESQRLSARLTDLDLSARGGADRIQALEQRLAEALARAEAVGGDATQVARSLTEARRALAAERTALEQARQEIEGQRTARTAAETATVAERTTRERLERDLTAAARDLASARAEMTEAQRLIARLREEAANLDRQVVVGQETIEARLADLARLTEQTRALTALRDQLERQAQAALARAGDEERRRAVAEAAATEANRARAAAEGTTAEAARARTAADAVAATAIAAARDAASGRAEAEARAAEQTRLAESARAQVALLTQAAEALRAELARMAAILDAEERAGRDRDAQITLLGQRLNAALAARVEELQRYRSDFFGRLRQVLGDRQDVRIVGDRFVFQSEVLFPVGSAELSPAGERQIRDIGRVLLDIAARIPPEVQWLLRVDGHADRAPIRGTGRFATNWELSSARALSVANVLMSEGLPPDRVAITAFAEFQPLDGADTAEARARNRRIELRLTDR